MIHTAATDVIPVALDRPKNQGITCYGVADWSPGFHFAARCKRSRKARPIPSTDGNSTTIRWHDSRSARRNKAYISRANWLVSVETEYQLIPAGISRGGSAVVINKVGSASRACNSHQLLSSLAANKIT